MLGAIDDARASRLHELAVRMGGIIAALPVSGWPTALFARRDALILVLASTGLPYSRISNLRICDVAADHANGLLRIRDSAGAETFTPVALESAGVVAARVLRCWLDVQGHNHRYPSTRLLAETVTGGDGTELVGYDRHLRLDSEQPLLTSIDRWGHTPLVTNALSPRAVASIVCDHLLYRAPAHSPRVLPRIGNVDEAPPSLAQDTVLDAEYYERGTAARRKALRHMKNSESVLDEVEQRAETLLAELLTLLGDSSD